VSPGALLMGKWRIVRELAHGGTSTVYEAVHRNGRRAAVKVLRPGLAADHRGRARFLRESSLANRVDHPGVISVIDEDITPDGMVFLVMELLVGETLEQRWTRLGRRVPAGDAIAIAAEMMEPLVAVHHVGIIHRDLKPSNVFLSTQGLKLLDFGVARLREISADESAITRSGSMLGTPAFMAPEQARGHWDEVDARTDIWAASAILFALLTGRFVHDGETPNELLIASATQAPVSLARFAPDVPAALVALVDRGLLRDKQLRWPDAALMLAELRAIQKLVPGTWQPVPAQVERNANAGVQTLPDESAAQNFSTPRRWRIVARPVRALLIGTIGLSVVAVSNIARPRHGSTSPVAASIARAAETSGTPDIQSGKMAVPAHARDDASVSISSPAPPPAQRVRHPRPKTLAPPRNVLAASAEPREAAPDAAPEPRTSPTHRTFSGIVVDEDALDQR
jgi:eukaryotic-like serine/threonine-protein kinase